MYFGYQVSPSFFFPTRTSFPIYYSRLLKIISSRIRQFLDRDCFSALYYNFIALEALEVKYRSIQVANCSQVP